MRVEFEMKGREMIDAYQFAAIHGTESEKGIAYLRRWYALWALGSLIASALIVIGWIIYIDRTASNKNELATQPASAWYLWGMIASGFISLMLFFGAVHCFERWRKPELAIREQTLDWARIDAWEDVDERCAIEADDRGVTFEDPDKSTTYKYSKVHGIDRSDRFIFVYIDPDVMYSVPIRINDTTRIDELIKLIEEHAGIEARFIPA